MTPALLSLLTFFAVLLTALSVASIVSDVVLRDRSRVNRRLDEEFHHHQKERARNSSLFKDLHKIAAKAMDEQEAALSWGERLARILEQAGLEWTLWRFWSTTLAVTAAASLVGGTLHGGLLGLILSALVAFPTTFVYVHFKRRRRLETLRSQLPDAYDLMARALRAGQTIAQTMQGVAEEFAQPIAGEFSYCYEQQNLGLPAEVALHDLARRTGLIEIHIFVVAVVVQRQVGGNLAEMLEGLAHVVRERYRIRGSIRTLTAEGRLQAGVLMALPPAMFLAMLILNREYAMVLFAYPSLLVAIVVSMAIGALWIRKIINFDF